MTRDLPTNLVLHRFGSDRIDGNVCFNNMVSYLEGTSPTSLNSCPFTAAKSLRSSFMYMNDSLGHEERQLLIPFIPRVVETQPYEQQVLDYAIPFLIENHFRPLLASVGYPNPPTEENASAYLVDVISDGIDFDIECEIRFLSQVRLRPHLLGDLVLQWYLFNGKSVHDVIEFFDKALKSIGK